MSKSFGKQAGTVRNVSTWVFKKPMRVINFAGSGIVVKSDFGARRVGKNMVESAFNCSKGLNVVGMQVHGVSIQEDVLGKFSFNMEGPLFSKSSLGKNGLLHGHEPHDIGQIVLNEAFSSGVSLTSNNMDHHDDFVDPEFGIGTTMVVEQAASTSGEAEQLHN
ncbi:unnamed protein product [Prunus armeniaca]|uniref:Uncharacterized protein n=1 Tax=Prunus armeniaca TaxID=36596 RepID=A0A6J5U144_PRUAR|nr:unnamed protein product [Prunus armeniaca]CAB4300270.1 unnamed protein product [Prunus armeniaca]